MNLKGKAILYKIFNKMLRNPQITLQMNIFIIDYSNNLELIKTLLRTVLDVNQSVCFNFNFYFSFRITLSYDVKLLLLKIEKPSKRFGLDRLL